MRAFTCLAVVAVIHFAPAPISAAAPANYYGQVRGSPARGYQDEMTPDGYWKIKADSRRSDTSHAIDVAMYRAAELARATGHKYVEMHDARSTETKLGVQSTTVFARGTQSAVHPAACRSGKRNRCYTADVAAVISQLSGPSGREPAVPIPTLDEYGRKVFTVGYGKGAVQPVR